MDDEDGARECPWPISGETHARNFNIIIGIVFIGGGLSGNMALIGTDSGVALAAVGLIMVGIGGYRLFKSRTSN